MRVSPIEKHKNCLKQVSPVSYDSPHKGRVECIDPFCKHKNKFIKWANAKDISDYCNDSLRVQDLFLPNAVRLRDLLKNLKTGPTEFPDED
jgi:hypothetical protein